MTSFERPYYPIIYVRGYAGSQSAVEETSATPYMGFNLGATKLRQDWKGKPLRHVFESPLIRLMKDHEYRDVYEHGQVIGEDRKIQARSVVIYRYYDQVSKDLGQGQRPEIEVFAEGLSELILQLKKQMCEHEVCTTEEFRVYLVAHSMGGLICRAFLQNPELGTDEAKACVDKVFTYATPHNGIDVRVLNNIPSILTFNNVDNFNRGRMAKYLALAGEPERVDSLGGKFPEERFFSLVGTNNRDYTVASGWSRRAVGPMSDGLVRIANATVAGTPRAFVHRAHSGHYGIVNSEEGYQNLTRFLFGNVRVDGVLRIHELSLPRPVEKAKEKGKTIRASYHFETNVRPRGARYFLHRRNVDQESAIHRTYAELFEDDTQRSPHLFSVFLTKSARTRGNTNSPLVFAVDIRVAVPEYEIDGFLFFDDHVEGATLFDDTLLVSAVPPADANDEWTVRYGSNAWVQNPTPRKAERHADHGPGHVSFHIPIESPGGQRPGMRATLELRTSDWQ